jgi:hypothetical protein
MPFFEKGDVRIRYEEAEAGFPLLVMPGGSMNSRISNWATAPFNAMEEFTMESVHLAPHAEKCLDAGVWLWAMTVPDFPYAGRRRPGRCTRVCRAAMVSS